MRRKVTVRSLMRRDALVAGLLAALLGACWAWRDWAALSALRLPDTDDLMRLQQIRDWLAGQGFADVTQHRLAGAVPMHWSRLPDLVPAALIALLSPLVGGHAAEVAAVVAWPVMLFAAALLLVARIARVLGAEPPVAAAIAAIAYPATTLFLPGRIDHHGLQLVLLLGAVLAQLRRPSAGAGVAAGLLAAASLVIGLETVPFLGLLSVLALAEWVAGRGGADERLQGLGVGALVGLAAGKGLFATGGWTVGACDGFTAEAWRAGLALAPVPLVLAMFDARLAGWRSRALAAMAVSAAAGALALWLSPGCLSPYGAVDPLAARLWLTHVGEAQGLFAAPPATALGYAGLLLVGLGAAAWQVRATRDRDWATLALLLLASLLVTLSSLRGAYAGALLAAPALAAAVAAERARGAWRLAAAWAASAGMLWPLAADALAPASAAAPNARGDCTSPAMLAALAALPPGTVMAPVDAGAVILAGTRQRVVAAPYHRQGAGIAASYRFYQGEPQKAAATATAWNVDYALSCAAMPGPARARALPGWHTARVLPDGAVIYAPGLSREAAQR